MARRAETRIGMEQPSVTPQPPSSPEPLIQPLDEHTFDSCVGSASVPVLVEFTAPWCAPCRALEPILHELAAEGRGRWSIAKVDGDRHPELATRFGVRGFPTLLLFAGGHEVARQLGLTPKKKLLAMLTQPTQA
jgi:thioredoxin 1